MRWRDLARRRNLRRRQQCDLADSGAHADDDKGTDLVERRNLKIRYHQDAIECQAVGGHLSTDEEPGKRSFQPMNVNFGLFPDLEPGSIVKPEGVKRFRGKDKTIMKRQLMAVRALTDCAAWLGVPAPVFAQVEADGDGVESGVSAA